MKQILVISGKGGTGKTVITASFAVLAKNCVIADCDVDAADLYLLVTPKKQTVNDFYSGVSARIDINKCKQCGLCKGLCRFEAISQDFVVNPVDCEGCAFCSFVCPFGAIEMKENLAGQWFVSETDFGPMVHAKLGVAQENSGKLVSLVRKEAKALADKIKADWVIIDGSPGIGCPVIASLSGIDLAVVVTEPTMSGLHDAKRVIELAKHFKIPVSLVINKYDLNIEIANKIQDYCNQNSILFLGKIGYDKEVVRAMVEGKPIVNFVDNFTTKKIKQIWEKINEN